MSFRQGGVILPPRQGRASRESKLFTSGRRRSPPHASKLIIQLPHQNPSRQPVRQPPLFQRSTPHHANLASRNTMIANPGRGLAMSHSGADGNPTSYVQQSAKAVKQSRANTRDDQVASDMRSLLTTAGQISPGGTAASTASTICAT